MSGPLSFLLAGALLALSGLFSGSETALFSLAPPQRARAGARAGRLLEGPRELLLTILLGNLFVNLLYFALVPVLFGGAGTRHALLAGLIALVALLLLGEILPKTLALRAPVFVARLVALPLTLLVRALGPLRRVVGAALEVMLRATGESEREERAVTPEALAAALDKSAADGVLRVGEADLLAEIVELGSMRVREIMTPRVDMLALDFEDGPQERARVLRETERRRLTWLPVVRGEADRVEGRVEVRDLLAHPDKPLSELAMPATFVPEVAPVLTMLATLRRERVAEAVVVDEWGGTAGVVTLEDLFEEIVGELRVEGETVEKPVIPLGEGRYRVSGGLSIRDWNDLLGTEIVPNAFETVGGYVTALLGRLPEADDRVRLGGGLACQVHEVRGRRVLTLDLYLEEGTSSEGEAA